jgi:tetratricopeptide (TPR) repeat protein
LFFFVGNYLKKESLLRETRHSFSFLILRGIESSNLYLISSSFPSFALSLVFQFSFFPHVRAEKERMQDPCVKWLQALERAQEENDLEEESKVSNRLGRVYFQQSDYRAALRFHKRDVYLCECIGKKLGQAIGHRNVGDTYARLSQFGRAKKAYDRYLELSEEIQNRAEIQRAHVVLGNLLFAKAQAKKDHEKPEEAKSMLLQAREYHQKSLSLVSSLVGTTHPQRPTQTCPFPWFMCMITDPIFF